MANKTLIMFFALAIGSSFAQSNLLQITSPPSGTVVHPGEVVVIAVRAAPSVSNIAIVGRGPLGLSGTTNGQPLQFRLTIPSKITVGAYDVRAMGRESDGAFVASSPISLQVEVPKSRFNIQTQPSVLRFSAPGETRPLHVVGTSADGSPIDVTQSNQVSYSSENPQIATVNEQGIVTAVAPGSTRIIVNNGNYSYFVSARVGQRQR